MPSCVYCNRCHRSTQTRLTFKRQPTKTFPNFTRPFSIRTITYLPNHYNGLSKTTRTLFQRDRNFSPMLYSQKNHFKSSPYLRAAPLLITPGILILYKIRYFIIRLLWRFIPLKYRERFSTFVGGYKWRVYALVGTFLIGGVYEFFNCIDIPFLSPEGGGKLHRNYAHPLEVSVHIHHHLFFFTGLCMSPENN